VLDSDTLVRISLEDTYKLLRQLTNSLCVEKYEELCARAQTVLSMIRKKLLQIGGETEKL
jgi:hypothetical protein